ncbi:hypothetical protein, partial [Campylobacter armoricus]|uniref:hypothetical protein n=1 Tax=Campylobacter armoricus TaxID=2505970 RepID=UPI001F2A1916
VKFLKVDQSFITANFDVNGLGLTGTQMEGWQIESSDGGRTYIGYDPINYPTLGEWGGAETHELTASQNGIHSHNYTRYT